MQSYKNSEQKPAIMRGAPPAPENTVPAIDWDRPPWNRWAFQNISQILRTAPIYKNRNHSKSGLSTNVKPAELTYSPRDISELQFTLDDGTDTTIDQFLDDTYTDGLLILHHNNIIHESYYNDMQSHSLHLGQSVTKSIVATTAAVLIDQGTIDVNVPITRYLPELESTAWREATVQQVMDMTTGVRYNETYDERDSDVGKTDVASGWKPPPPDLDTSDWPNCLWDQILSLTVQDAEHGERFLYRSIETEVLAFAMERVTGIRLPQLISQLLWAPMGAEEDANITVDQHGCSTASGGISASLRDYARFGKLLLDKGMVEGRQVVPEWWVDDIRHGNHGLFSADGKEAFANGCYRNQFWIEDKDKSAHVCIGVFGQTIYVSPELDMVAVKLSTWPEFRNRIHLRNTIRAFHAIGDWES